MSFIKTYECEKRNLLIKWTEGGRIIFYHLDTNKPTGHIEPWTKTSLAKIIKFIEKDESAESLVIASFNAIARPYFDSSIIGLDILFTDEIFYGKKNNTKEATNKIYGHGTKQSLTMTIRKDDGFKRSTRYVVDWDNRGNIEFHELEKIAPDNLNASYSENIFNVY